MTRATRSSMILFAAAFSALALISCSDFFGNEDLRDSIREEVDIANAPQVTLTVTADPASGGSLSILGVATKKVGENFSITAIPFGGYTFAGWTAAGGGDVVFTDPSLPTTTARVGTEAADIVITANFSARPDVSDFQPTGTGVLLNQIIYAQFSKEMDPSTFTAETISVTAKPAGVPGAVPVSIWSGFDLSVSGSGFVLTPNTNMDGNTRVTLTVSKNVRDLAGNTMGGDFTWYFTTWTVADTSVPTFVGEVTVDKGQGFTEPAVRIPGGAFAVNAPPLTINVTGNSNSATVTVTAIEITETDVSSGESVTNWVGYLSPRTYTLLLPGEGEKTLTLRLRNSNGSVSAPAAVAVYLDQTPPVIDSILLAGGADYTGSLSPSLTIGSHYDSATGIGGYALSASSLVPAAWNETAPTAASLAADDGTKTVYLHVRDKAGNSAFASDSIVLDRTPPGVAVGDITTTGNPGWVRNDQTVTVNFSVTEGGSGLNGAPSVTIAGQPATLSGTFPEYSARLDFSGTSIPQGPVGYTIDASDLAGNPMTQVSASTGISYDREAPGVSIGSPSPASAKNGTDVSCIVTYDADAVVTLAKEQVQLAQSGTAAGAVKSVTGTGTTRTVTVTAGEGNGTLAFSLPAGTAADPAGNTAGAAGPSAAFTVDNRPPQVSVSGPSSALVNGSGSVSYTVTYDETGLYALTSALVTLNTAGDAAGTVSVAGGTTSSATVTISGLSGNGTLGITIEAGAMTDSAGNPSAASAASAAFTLDTTPPTITGESLIADASTIKGFSSADDDDGSGIDTSGFSLAGGTGSFDGTDITGLDTLSKGTSKDYTIGASDLAGNETTVTVRRYRDAAGDYTAEILTPPVGAFLPRFSAAARSLSTAPIAAASPAAVPFAAATRGVSAPPMSIFPAGSINPKTSETMREHPASRPESPPVSSRTGRPSAGPSAAESTQAAQVPARTIRLDTQAAAIEDTPRQNPARPAEDPVAGDSHDPGKAFTSTAQRPAGQAAPAEQVPASPVPARQAPGGRDGEKPVTRIEAVLPSGRKSPEEAAEESETCA